MAPEKWIMENRITPTIPEEDLPPFMRQMLVRGKREMLLRLIAHLGRVLTVEERARIDACTDGDTLQRWAGNLFIGKTGADIFD
ncbi:MAG: hypothetical protein U0441_28650 [Polyangiaceae bacterium]